jgi:hypothetical protein
MNSWELNLKQKIIMIESNPFSSEEFRKQILQDEGIVEPEVMEENSDEEFDLKDLIKSAPQIPKSAKNIIMDASALAKNDRERQEQEMNLALNNVFSDYNKKYGTDLQIDFSSLSKTLINCSDPQKRRTLELYVSEIFKSIKPILLLNLISKLSQLINYVVSPEVMFDKSQLSIPDMFLIVEKLQQYIMNLNDIIETSTIKDSDSILKKMAEEKNDAALDTPESKEVINDFLKLFYKETLEKKDDNKEN